MSDIISQNVNGVTHGAMSIVTTVVRMSAISATITLPHMSAASNSVVQLRRVGDAAVTVTQDSVTAVTITGSAAGTQVMLVSVHGDPIPASVEV